MLLIPKTAAEMSDGGIFIPEAARSGLTQGTILKRGSLVTEYNIGDEIIFAQHSESRIEIDGNPYLILNQTNVLLCKRGTISAAIAEVDPDAWRKHGK